MSENHREIIARSNRAAAILNDPEFNAAIDKLVAQHTETAIISRDLADREAARAKVLVLSEIRQELAEVMEGADYSRHVLEQRG
jgi:hypothetical protein